MKFRLIILQIFFLYFSCNFLFAQDDDETEIKMTQPEWHLKRDQYAVSAITLLSKLEKLNAQIDSLKNLNEKTSLFVFNFEDSLYSLVGATKSDVISYRRKFESVESSVNSKSGNPVDWRSSFNEITDSKIRCLPEFRERWAMLSYKIKNSETADNNIQPKTEKENYEVMAGDCLWKISEQKYGNPLYWTLIWDANKKGVVNKDNVGFFFGRRISNPDFIYPGQVINIPELNEKIKTDLDLQNNK